MKTILFYNPANLGDIHISRELVKYIMRVAPAESFAYCHKNSPRILADIARLEHRPVGLAFRDTNNHVRSFRVATSDTLCLNTWYAVSPVWNAGRGMGCTLNTLYELFCEHARRYFDHDITAPVESFLPRIDFSKFAIDRASRFLDGAAASGKFRKTVMFCNGKTMSEQTHMDDDDFVWLLARAAAANRDVLFLLTNVDPHLSLLTSPNVVYTRDVIGLPAEFCDLPENGYISTRCDVVIGRGSGAYSFAYLADNFLDEKKTMVCFTDDERTARWVIPYDTIRARIEWSNNYRPDSMESIVAEALR